MVHIHMYRQNSQTCKIKINKQLKKEEGSTHWRLKQKVFVCSCMCMGSQRSEVNLRCSPSCLPKKEFLAGLELTEYAELAGHKFKGLFLEHGPLGTLEVPAAQ